MFRLNVAAPQLEECVKQGMFALANQPQINVGEILLLQLKKGDWQSQGGNGGRIQHALVFQRLAYDADGSINANHWPNAGKTWPWIIYSSAVLEVKPFSLEELPLNRESHYQAQANPVRIDLEDEAIILPYIQWSSIAPLGEPSRQLETEAPIATDDTKEVVDFSVARAVAAAQTWYPHAQVEVMKHNNPGFDILVAEKGRVVRYIEVKGTRSATPSFHLTETERQYSANNAALYTLFVVWAIDLKAGTYKSARRDGELAVGAILKPERYVGRLQQ